LVNGPLMQGRGELKISLIRSSRFLYTGNMPEKYNKELIEERFKNVHKRVDEVHSEVNELESLVKSDYTLVATTNGIDKRVSKFESFWDWAIKIILSALIIGTLAILGLGNK